jgi:hypothetical protein
MALRSGNPHRLRGIAEKLIEKAEQGDLQAIQQIADRFDGKRAQTIERGDVTVEVLSDAELYAIAWSGSREPTNEPPLICGPHQSND